MNLLSSVAMLAGAGWLLSRWSGGPRHNPARRSTQRQAGLFDAGAAQLELLGGQGVRPDTAGDAARRLAALERQRDMLRARGYATADLDDQITRQRDRLRDTWRNPAFFTDEEGAIHPIRGTKDYDVAEDTRTRARHAKAHQAAVSGGLYHPHLPAGSGQIKTLRRRAEDSLRQVEHLEAERSEAPRGSFEQKYGIARPPASVLPTWRARFARERPDLRLKGHLTNRDVLRLWTAYQREHPDARPGDDWWNSLHADTYWAAMHGQVKAREWTAPSKRQIIEVRRDATADLRRAKSLAQLFRAKQDRTPHNVQINRQIDGVQRRLDAAMARGDEPAAIRLIGHIERLEAQLRPGKAA